MKSLSEHLMESTVLEWSPAPAVAARNLLHKSTLFNLKGGGGSSSTDTVKHVHHILDIMYAMAEEKEKVFGIKYDEICGNLVSHLWLHSKTLPALEAAGYIQKTGNTYDVLLTTTTKENTIPCEVSVPIYELTIPNTKTMQGYKDDVIKASILKAADRLKKTVKLY